MGQTAVVPQCRGGPSKDMEIATKQQGHRLVRFDAVYVSIVGRQNTQQNVHDKKRPTWVCTPLPFSGFLTLWQSSKGSSLLNM